MLGINESLENMNCKRTAILVGELCMQLFGVTSFKQIGNHFLCGLHDNHDTVIDSSRHTSTITCTDAPRVWHFSVFHFLCGLHDNPTFIVPILQPSDI